MPPCQCGVGRRRRTDHDQVHVIASCEVEQCGRRVTGFEYLERKVANRQLQGGAIQFCNRTLCTSCWPEAVRSILSASLPDGVGTAETQTNLNSRFNEAICRTAQYRAGCRSSSRVCRIDRDQSNGHSWFNSAADAHRLARSRHEGLLRIKRKVDTSLFGFRLQALADGFTVGRTRKMRAVCLLKESILNKCWWPTVDA